MTFNGTVKLDNYCNISVYSCPFSEVRNIKINKEQVGERGQSRKIK